jgi:RNA-directed DNA polymerase
MHKNRRYVLNLDLHDFFPTFNFGRVRGFFIKDREFAVPEKVATVIAQIACHENSLPQGSPCSPIIADVIAHILDVRLVQLVKTHKVAYSRYADDLTFSTNQKAFPAELATRDDGDGSEWQLSEPLVGVIERCGFTINPAKTRMQVHTSRQLVTGLTVNIKVNIPQDYYRTARSMCNALFQTGSYHQQVPASAGGDGDAGAGASAFEMVEKLDPVEGVLSHIYHIKSRAYQRDKAEKKAKPTPSHKLYGKFLFYKYFVAPAKPLIVCEGKTDNIYLRNAIRRLSQFHPILGSTTDHRFIATVSIFSYTNKAHQVIELTGGSGNLNGFINRYAACMKPYKHRPLKHPVIVLIDNDSGARKIFSDLKKSFDITCSLTSTDTFYHLTDNLYLIKTPESPGDGTSCIESFFDAPLKATLIRGKTFNPENNHNTATEYGKADFAGKVVVPNADRINWTPFSPLLERIATVVTGYKAPAVSTAKAA